MNITIIYTEYDDKYNRFVFTFNDLDEYQIIEYVDKETCQITDYEQIELITRLVNAYNAFRHWEPSQRYIAVEIRKALEDIARKNSNENVWKVYKFATLGSRPKIAEKILYEVK